MSEARSASEAATLLRNSGARLIAVDGAHGSGKSFLAREIGELLGTEVVSLDDYLERNKGAYVDFLDLRRLSARVGAVPAAIVEGICVLQVLEQIGVEADAFVYVKRSSHGYWLDEEDLDVKLPVEEHLEVIRRRIAPIAEFLGESGELGLTEEVIRYHAAYRPHERESIVFLRDDS